MSTEVDSVGDLKGGRVARAAAMLCQQPAFQRWLDRRRHVLDGTHNEQVARDWMVGACGITSRRELDHNRRAALMFRKIVVAFQQDTARPPAVGDPKRHALRLPTLLGYASDAPCMRCSRQDGTTVAAHYQGPRGHTYGKGMAIKPDDNFVAFLCAGCHALLDSYQNGDQELMRSEEFLHLVAMTMNWCIRHGVLREA